MEGKRPDFTAEQLRITGVSPGINSYPFSFGVPMDTRQQLFLAFPGIARTQPGGTNGIPPLTAFRTGPVRANGDPRRPMKVDSLGLRVEGVPQVRKAKSAKQRPASPGVKGNSKW